MDITFNCDKCGQHIAIDEAGAGTFVNCQTCQVPLKVPDKPTLKTPTPPPPVSDTKKCHFCAEVIKIEAIVCRFCGRDLAEKSFGDLFDESPAQLVQSPVKSAFKLPAIIILGLCLIVFLYSVSDKGKASSNFQNQPTHPEQLMLFTTLRRVDNGVVAIAQFDGMKIDPDAPVKANGVLIRGVPVGKDSGKIWVVFEGNIDNHNGGTVPRYKYIRNAE
ncbi:MAG: hypothetical protein WCG79_10490 [Verrucomicrobiota bacterium]